MEIFRRIQSADSGGSEIIHAVCGVCTCRDNCQSVNLFAGYFFIKKKNMYRFNKLQ